MSIMAQTCCHISSIVTSARAEAFGNCSPNDILSYVGKNSSQTVSGSC